MAAPRGEDEVDALGRRRTARRKRRRRRRAVDGKKGIQTKETKVYGASHGIEFTVFSPRVVCLESFLRGITGSLSLLLN